MVRYIIFITLVCISMLCSAVAFSQEKYSPRNCEFTAVFPGTPIIKDIYVTGHFHQSATLIRRNSVLRASCSIFNNNSVFDVDDQAIIEWGKNWAQRMGTIYPEISINKTNLGKVLTIKGTKNIEGNPFTYKGIIHHGQYSRMAVLVGAPAESYPTSEIISFLKSAYINGKSL